MGLLEMTVKNRPNAEFCLLNERHTFLNMKLLEPGAVSSADHGLFL